ncbi:hypothetical protein OIV83_000965 [Microbotryomycetes sp. JL201]|nr:hypothetical protein OIV83_000965 [Microbotryomycetes sp. JL201]
MASTPPAPLVSRRPVPPRDSAPEPFDQVQSARADSQSKQRKRIQYLLSVLAASSNDPVARPRPTPYTPGIQTCTSPVQARSKSFIEIKARSGLRPQTSGKMSAAMPIADVVQSTPKRAIKRKPAPQSPSQPSDHAHSFHIEIERHFSSWSTLHRNSTCSTASSSPMTPRSSLFEPHGSPVTLEEDMQDGLWTSSCDSDIPELPAQYSCEPERRASVPVSPKSPSSFASTFGHLRRKHARTTSAVSALDMNHISKISRRRSGESFELPMLKLPDMPLLFPEGWDAARHDEALHASVDVKGPSSGPPSASSEENAPRRPNVFRIMTGGKAYFIQDVSSSESEYHSVDDQTSGDDEDVVLDIC